MTVNVEFINLHRMRSWTAKLIAAHATPVLLLGVGHDHNSGKITLVVTEDLTSAELRAFLMAALVEISRDDYWEGSELFHDNGP